MIPASTYFYLKIPGCSHCRDFSIRCLLHSSSFTPFMSKMVTEEDSVEEIDSEEEDETVTALKPEVFTLELLKLIKDAQQQHGLRHGDYQRYRGYCTRRIRRLRKVLKIPQGDKRHFKRKDVTEAMLKDERFLYIPLMMAERAWGYAMQLRQEANTEPRKRFHLIGRLRKATKYALHLEDLCEGSKCDARTKLEASAYVAWIHGALHFELQLWKPAMENLKKAQVVYEKLASALPEEERAIYKARVDELTPSLRYCAYNIGDGSSIEDLLQMRSQGQGDLLANLDSLIVQTREHRAEVLCEVEWRGRSIPVRPERVRVFLLSEQELEQQLARAADCSAKIALLETLLMDCKDAIMSVKDEMKLDPNAKQRVGQSGPISAIQYLLTYLTHIRLSRTIQRNLLMVEAAKTALADKTEGGGGSDVRKARPQDLTRLYEIILQNVVELQQLAGLEDDVDYQREVEVKARTYKAFRCFYIAQSLLALKRWREAVALYKRSEQYAQEALKGKLDDGLKTNLQTMVKEIASQEFSAHAQSVLEEEGQETEGTAVGVRGGLKSKMVPLYDRLGEYKEDPSLTSRNPNVFKLPPEMQPIPCKPLFFDLGFNFVEFPSLDDKVDAPQGGGKKAGPAGITGFVKGLWGWNK